MWSQSNSPEESYSDTWAQQDVFLGEAYGDYLCVQGGLEALLEDLEKDESDSGKYILFTTAEYFETRMMPELEGDRVQTQFLYSRGQYLALAIESKQ